MTTPLPARLNNLRWELRLGISTRGIVPVDHADSLHYATMNYSTIHSILDQLALGPSDRFVDVGSGKGRVLCCAARYPVKQVVGVDLSEALCQVARENARRMRGRRAPISVETSVAQNFDYSAATALFLFHPFGADTRSAPGENRSRLTGSVRIAYATPETMTSSSVSRGWSAPDAGTRKRAEASTPSRSTEVGRTVQLQRVRPADRPEDGGASFLLRPFPAYGNSCPHNI